MPWVCVLLMDYELFTKTLAVSKAAAVRLCISLGLGGFSAAHQQSSGTGSEPFPHGATRLTLSLPLHWVVLLRLQQLSCL